MNNGREKMKKYTYRKLPNNENLKRRFSNSMLLKARRRKVLRSKPLKR
jgi:hypothetical protein